MISISYIWATNKIFDAEVFIKQRRKVVFQLIYRFAMRFILSFLLLAFCVSPSAYSDTGRYTYAVRSINLFGLRMGRLLNVILDGRGFAFSPFSIASALGMLYEGADGTTKEAFETVTQFDDTFGEGWRDMRQAIKDKGIDTGVMIASRVWVTI